MLMYNLIEYSDNYSYTSGSLCGSLKEMKLRLIMLIWLLLMVFLILNSQNSCSIKVLQ